MDPQAPEAHAVLRRLKGKSERAASCEIPGHPQLSRAHCSAHRGDISSAAKELIAKQAVTPRAVYWSFQIYKRLAQVAAAKLAEVAPESPWLYLLRAQIAEQNGRDAEAEQEYQRAVAAREADSESHIRFGKFLCKQQRFDAAIERYERAMSFDPENARVPALIGEVHATQGRPEKALPYLETALRSRPNETQTRIYLARSLIQLKRTTEAIAVLEAAPDDPDGRIHYVLGQALQQLGYSEKAREAMNIFRQRRANAMVRTDRPVLSAKNKAAPAWIGAAVQYTAIVPYDSGRR